jgi:hypothetical protein
MVDALESARSVLAPRGVVIDARPDSRVNARVEHDGRTVAVLRTQPIAAADDRHSDDAVVLVKQRRVLRRVRAGRFWHRIPFADRAELDAYLEDHLRFVHRPVWTPLWRARAREWRDDPLEVVRAIRFEILEPASGR